MATGPWPSLRQLRLEDTRTQCFEEQRLKASWNLGGDWGGSEWEEERGRMETPSPEAPDLATPELTHSEAELRHWGFHRHPCNSGASPGPLCAPGHPKPGKGT
jgi:hypothetical protein